MGSDATQLAVRWLRLAILPVASAIALGVGTVSWLRVPSPSRLAALTSERDALQLRMHERESRNDEARNDEGELAVKLPPRLAFADFLERLNESATESGIDGLHIESKVTDRSVAPSDGLRGFAGTVRFESGWNELVRFLAEIERGMPVMRVRSLLAEPTEDSIRVECVVDAWSLPVVEVSR